MGFFFLFVCSIIIISLILSKITSGGFEETGGWIGGIIIGGCALILLFNIIEFIYCLFPGSNCME
jgi:hypothetical protein